MKKLFTIDDFMVAFVAALGYGYGETISRLAGWPTALCIVASMVLGIVLEMIISRIVFSRTVQKNKTLKILIFAAIILLFLAAQYISVKGAGVSMLDYLSEEFVYVIILPVIGFVINIIIRKYRIYRIQKLYGDGSEGYVFDVKSEDFAELNKENQPITGKYNKELAVKARTGIFVGEKYKKTVCYMGIPYAKPPVGELRWKAPEALPASDAVYEAMNFGASALQLEHRGSILKNHRQSEDCLYLNICVSTQKAESKRPVFVVFHHGDFSYGGAADPLLYVASYVNDHPESILVSFNYRLGILGFIDFSEVAGGEACPDAINLGLLDQIAALEWIKENIEAFGGDPERITVLGFDAGATSVCMLAVSERARGLFNKAFLFNGNLETVYDTPDVSRALAKALLAETGAKNMNELMQLDTGSLKAAAQKLWQYGCAPTCDGKLIPEDVYNAYQNGAASGIEFVIGIPCSETRVFRSVLGKDRYEEFINTAVSGILDYLDGPVADAVREYIRKQTEHASDLEAKSKFVDQWIALGIYRIAVKLHEGGNKVQLLYWDQKALIENLGSGTIDAAAALLGNVDALEIYGSVMDKDLSMALQTLLQKFVTGEALQLYPNEIKGFDALDWKAYPKALIVSDDKLKCDIIENRLTEVDGLLDIVVQ